MLDLIPMDTNQIQNGYEMDIQRVTMNGSTSPLMLLKPREATMPVKRSAEPATSPSASSSGDKTVDRPPLDDMTCEEARLGTFEKWPVTFLSPDRLAADGFYYLGRGDEVRCAFCKVEIMRWVEGDDPAVDHQRWAPQCPFVRARLTAEGAPAADAVGRDECGVRPAPLQGPAHPAYASEAARLRTFKDWPRSMRQKPEELAEAGFYYTGHGDKTKCFYCGGGLKDWEAEDVPWEQHARWFDRCAFVQLVKGREYVQRVVSEACAVNEPEPVAEPEPELVATATGEERQPQQTAEEETSLCKVCFAEERNVCFVPCGHVVCCARCALATTRCPMCRRGFTSAVRLYFS